MFESNPIFKIFGSFLDSSIITIFYKDKAKNMYLARVFQKNIKLFETSIGVSETLPSFSEIEKFLIPCSESQEVKKQLSFHRYFQLNKSFLLCIFSIFEILTARSFDVFVIYIYT